MGQESSKNNFCKGVIIAVVAAGIVASAYFGTTILQKKKEQKRLRQEVVETSPTMRAIHNRGYITCGVTNQPGFAMLDEDGTTWEGYEVDLCAAVAAGIFGMKGSKKDNVKIIPVEVPDRFTVLGKKGIDVLLAMTSHTVERSLFEVSLFLQGGIFSHMQDLCC